MAKAKKQEEVLTIEAEEIIDAPVSEMVQKTIDTEIKRFDPFEARLNELKEQYSGLAIKDVNDREGYEDVRLAIGELRKVRTETEKDKKAIKAPFLKACASIEEKSKWIIREVSKIEDPLQARKDEIDAERDRIKAEKKAQQDKQYTIRSLQLTKLGGQFTGTHFTIADHEFEAVLVRECDEDIYISTILPPFQAAYEAAEMHRVEQERIAAEAAQKLADERAELERIRKEQQEQADKLKAEADRLARLQAEALEAERVRKAQAEEQLWRGRLNQLNNVGWNGKEAFARYDETIIIINYDQLLSLSNEDWHKIRDDHNAKNDEVAETKRLADKKKAVEMEAQRLAELEQARKEAEERQAKAVAEALAQAERQAEERRQKELAEKQRLEAEESERQAQLGDKEIVKQYVSTLKAVQVATPKSGQYRKIVNDIKAYLNAL